jgi:hypothetical protein
MPGYARSIIYRGSTNSFAAATQIEDDAGTNVGPGKPTTYVDSSPGTGSRYYWVRPVSSGGIQATAPTGPTAVLTFP